MFTRQKLLKHQCTKNVTDIVLLIVSHECTENVADIAFSIVYKVYFLLVLSKRSIQSEC